MPKICGVDGCFQPVFGGKMCKSHQYLRTDKKPRQLAKTRLKRQSAKARRQLPAKKEELIKQWKFFEEIWNERPHASEVSGKYIAGEPLSVYFHHILPKRNYPELKFVKGNIIILTFDEHQMVEADPYAFHEVNVRREVLKTILGL